MNVRLAAALVLPFIAASLSGLSARPFTPRDAVAFAVPGTPQISPAGDRIAFLVTHSDYQSNSRETDLVVYTIASQTSTVVRHDVAGIGTPQWSPDGVRLAYVRDVGEKSTTSQVVIDPLTVDAPVPATAAPEGVDQFAWSPGGDALAYTSPDAPLKGHGAADAFEAGDGGYLDHAAPAPEHLYIVDLLTTHTRRLTAGRWTIAAQPLSWTPNAREIVFTKVANTYNADNYVSTIAAVNIATGALRAITHHRTVESAPAISPDGTKLAYLYQHAGDPAAVQDLRLTTPSGGDGVALTGAALDINVAGWMWLATRARSSSAPMPARNNRCGSSRSADQRGVCNSAPSNRTSCRDWRRARVAAARSPFSAATSAMRWRSTISGPAMQSRSRSPLTIASRTASVSAPYAR
jgi:dipeptidyl aminopeptidase/acylaminoacyl peptidase